MFEKVLVANRGEIAIRVMRTLKEMGIASVGVYSEADREAPHVGEADEAYLLGPPGPAESYLNIEKILETAEKAGAQAIHPGYGFLAENADFAEACEKAGVVFIGPPASAIEAMGSKTRARELMRRPGCRSSRGRRAPPRMSPRRRSRPRRSATRSPARRPAVAAARAFASRAPRTSSRTRSRGPRARARSSSRTRRVYLERYLEDPRHVEVQVLADSHGNVVHLGERDCSIQRRHQKLIEEAPAPHVDEEMRERIGKIATDAAAAVGYRSAGTVEGLAGRRRVLLPRDEHPRPGRALRDRDGHRHRHRARADPDRRRRGALVLPGGRRAPRARDRVPDQRRGGPQEVRPGARDDHQLRRAGRPRRARGLRRRGRAPR